jgi:hypothetical protein
MRRTVIVISALILMATFAAWAQKGSDPITQGDFAVLLASHLNSPTPQSGWTQDNAIAFLASATITPVRGSWTGAALLTEGDLVHMLRAMGLAYYSPTPDAVVTWAEANAVLNRFGDFFRRFSPVARSVDGSTTTHIYTGIGDTSSGAPASPSTP